MSSHGTLADLPGPTQGLNETPPSPTTVNSKNKAKVIPQIKLNNQHRNVNDQLHSANNKSRRDVEQSEKVNDRFQRDNDQPNSVDLQSLDDDDQPLDDDDQTLDDDDRPPSEGDRPSDEEDQPPDEEDRPLNNGGRPLNNGGRPLNNGGRPLNNGGRPLNNGGRPLNNGEQPLNNDDQLPNGGDQHLGDDDQLLNDNEQSISNADQPPKRDYHTPNNVERPPNDDYLPNGDIHHLQDNIDLPLPKSNKKARVSDIASPAIDSIRPLRRSSRSKEHHYSLIPKLPNPNFLQKDIKNCQILLDSLKKNNCAWPFLTPVDPVAAAAPDYFDVIKQPMDISTVQSKLLNNHYNSPSDLVSDLRLMFDNCFTYNPPSNLVYQYGKSLENHFDLKLFKIFPNFPDFPTSPDPDTTLPASPDPKISAPPIPKNKSTRVLRNRGKTSLKISSSTQTPLPTQSTPPPPEPASSPLSNHSQNQLTTLKDDVLVTESQIAPLDDDLLPTKIKRLSHITPIPPQSKKYIKNKKPSPPQHPSTTALSSAPKKHSKSLNSSSPPHSPVSSPIQSIRSSLQSHHSSPSPPTQPIKYPRKRRSKPVQYYDNYHALDYPDFQSSSSHSHSNFSIDHNVDLDPLLDTNIPSPTNIDNYSHLEKDNSDWEYVNDIRATLASCLKTVNAHMLLIAKRNKRKSSHRKYFHSSNQIHPKKYPYSNQSSLRYFPQSSLKSTRRPSSRKSFPVRNSPNSSKLLKKYRDGSRGSRNGNLLGSSLHTHPSSMRSASSRYIDKKSSSPIPTPQIKCNPDGTKKVCEYCKTSKTPMWRRGPSGCGTLCNKCGVKWRSGKILGPLPNSQLLSPSSPQLHIQETTYDYNHEHDPSSSPLLISPITGNLDNTIHNDHNPPANDVLDSSSHPPIPTNDNSFLQPPLQPSQPLTPSEDSHPQSPSPPHPSPIVPFDNDVQPAESNGAIDENVDDKSIHNSTDIYESPPGVDDPQPDLVKPPISDSSINTALNSPPDTGITYEQKKELSVLVAQLSDEDMYRAAEIIRSKLPHLRDIYEDIELDIDAIDDNVLSALYDFVKSLSSSDKTPNISTSHQEPVVSSSVTQDASLATPVTSVLPLVSLHDSPLSDKISNNPDTDVISSPQNNTDDPAATAHHKKLALSASE